MNSELPHIAIIIEAREITPALLVSLHRLTGSSLSELKTVIAKHQPIICAELFSNDFYDTGISRLRDIIKFLKVSNITSSFYELAEGERYETADLNNCVVTPDIIENILNESAHRYDNGHS